MKLLLTLIVFTYSIGNWIKSDTQHKIKLGEDLTEINCYVKKIYKIDNLIYVDIDLINVTITPEGERTIVNQNPKIRTYIINDDTIIVSKKCENLDSNQTLDIETSILHDKLIVVIGSSKNGIMESINFGCYG